MNSNCLWDMVSTCLIGNATLTPLLRLMTNYKLFQLKDEFYKIIENDYITKIDDCLLRYKEVHLYFLKLLFAARCYDNYGSKFHLLVLSTVLRKNIKVLEPPSSNTDGTKQNIETYSPILENFLTKESLFSIFEKATNHYDAVIPYLKQ